MVEALGGAPVPQSFSNYKVWDYRDFPTPKPTMLQEHATLRPIFMVMIRKGCYIIWALTAERFRRR